jgi:hypothetical protein
MIARYANAGRPYTTHRTPHLPIHHSLITNRLLVVLIPRNIKPEIFAAD